MKHLRFWTACAVLYAVAIFIGSAIPGPDLPAAIQTVSDKLLHATEYGLFGFIVLRAIRGQSRFPRIARHAMAAATLAVVVYGASDEFHQLFVPGRVADVFDWLADATGGGIGVMFATWLASRTRRASDRASHEDTHSA